MKRIEIIHNKALNIRNIKSKYILHSTSKKELIIDMTQEKQIVLNLLDHRYAKVEKPC